MSGGWIFGYGSLVWRPAFAHVERRPAWICGWVRRFWQGSSDHRGVPGAPGRVVTLEPEPAATCWGIAYRVRAAALPAVLEGLDRREQGGFRRREVPIFLSGDGARPRPGLVYVAEPGNPDYLGPAPLEQIARQVLRASGPSGPNREYVERLCEALREIGAEDPHVFALERLLRAGEERR